MKVQRNNTTAHNPQLKYDYSSKAIEKKSHTTVIKHSIRSDECSLMDSIFEEFKKVAKTEGNNELEFWKLSDDGKDIERNVNVDEDNIIKEL